MKNDPLIIHAYVDGETSPEERAAVEARIASDQQSSLLYLAIRDLKITVQKHVQPVPHDELWSQCRKRLAEIDGREKAERFVTKYAWGICGAFLLAIVLGGVVNRYSPERRVQPQDLSRMMNLLALPSFSRQPQQAQQVIQQVSPLSKLRFQFENETPISVSTAAVSGHPIGRITLQDPEGRVALLVIADSDGVEGTEPMGFGSDYCAGRFADINCVSWQDAHCTMIIVGDRSFVDLANVAQRIRVE